MSTEQTEHLVGDKASREDKAAPVPRIGRVTELQACTPAAVDFLYALACDPEVGWRWRFGGTVPRRDVYEQNFWQGILAQFVVVERSSSAMIGHVLAYNADLNYGIAYVAAAMISQVARSGAGIEAIDLFVSHLFGSFRLRKLYFEVPEYNLPQFGSAVGTLLRREGELAEHSYYNGQFWSQHVLALYRDDYETIGPRSATFGRNRRPTIQPTQS